MRRPDARAMAQLLAEQTQTAAGLILRLAWRQGLTREEIQRLIGAPVYLDLWVKVTRDWKNKDYVLRELGYKEHR